jgi:S-DNA-T family DNA segregation ATPase FtsK/SpoIIIE
VIPLRNILPKLGTAQAPIQTIIGLEDLDLRPAVLDLQQRGPHFLLIGPPLSGKTTTLRSWIISLAHSYTPHQVGLVLIDFQQRLFEYGGKRSLAHLPHVLNAISEADDMTKLLQNLKAEYEGTHHPTRELFVIIDNYDDLVNTLGPSTRTTLYKDLGVLARKYGPSNLHVVICGSLGILRSLDDLLKQVMSPRYGLGLDASESPVALGGRIRGGTNTGAEFPPGRGFVVKSGRLSLIQVATPGHEATLANTMDEWITEIANQYPQRAAWYATQTPQAEPTPPPTPQPTK